MKQNILRYSFLPEELNNLLNLSIFKNEEVKPFTRLAHRSETLSQFSKLKTQQKLKCMVTYNKRVPSKRFLFSRYFLTKKFDLNI